MDYLGELAAVGTAVLWASNSVFLTLAGKRVGSQTVNAARLFLALGVMVLLHLVLYGTSFPLHIGWTGLMALGLSGLVGLALADACLFESMLILGPRVALVLTTLSPIFSTFLAWAILGQSLSLMKLGAILGTSVGVACVVWERAPGAAKDLRRTQAWAFGVSLGIGAALGQAVGLLLSDIGMAGGLPPISANLIRLTAGTAAITLWIVFQMKFKDNVQRLRDRRAFLLIVAGAATGPVLGVLLALFAITHAPMGVAAALMSLSPVFLLPVSASFFKEKVTLMGIAGTILSIVGACALVFA